MPPQSSRQPPAPTRRRSDQSQRPGPYQRPQPDEQQPQQPRLPSNPQPQFSSNSQLPQQFPSYSNAMRLDLQPNSEPFQLIDSVVPTGSSESVQPFGSYQSLPSTGTSLFSQSYPPPTSFTAAANAAFGQRPPRNPESYLPTPTQPLSPTESPETYFQPFQYPMFDQRDTITSPLSSSTSPSSQQHSEPVQSPLVNSTASLKRPRGHSPAPDLPSDRRKSSPNTMASSSLPPGPPSRRHTSYSTTLPPPPNMSQLDEPTRQYFSTDMSAVLPTPGESPQRQPWDINNARFNDYTTTTFPSSSFLNANGQPIYPELPDADTILRQLHARQYRYPLPSTAPVAAPPANPDPKTSPIQVPKDPKEFIDLDTFAQIREMDEEEDEDGNGTGGREFSRGIVFGYFEQAENTFKDMNDAVAAKDLPKLSSLGHFLKGSSAALGIIKVQASCEKMQHYGVKRDEEVGQDLGEDEALERIKKLLKNCERDYQVAKIWLTNLYETDGEVA